MNTPPIISVIVPTYNAEPFLRQALDSCIAQTYPHLEVICVNDGSKDKSLEIIEEYVTKDNRFKLINQPNGGYGKAMNAGFDAATGKYMAILEPDDYLPPNAYKLMIEKAESYNLDIVKGCVERFRMNGTIRKVVERSTISKAFLNRVVKPREEVHVFNETMNTWTCLYRMEFLRQHNIRHNESPGAAYQDAGMHKLSFSYAERLMCIKDIVYCYRTDNPNSSVAGASVNKQPYAHRKEYDFIVNRLKETPDVWEAVRDVTLAAKMRGFIWVYVSVPPYEKRAFVDSFREEMRTYPQRAFSFLNNMEYMKMDAIMQGTDIFMLTETIAARLRISQSEIIRRMPNIPKTLSCEPASHPSASGNLRRTYKLLGIPVCSVQEKQGRKTVRLFGIRVAKTKVKK